MTDIIKKLSTNDFKNLRLNNLGELEGTGHLSQGILKLFEDSSKYDLIIRVAEVGYDNNGSPLNALTIKTNGKLEWTITLDDDYLRNATQFAIARTIIHESIHAFLGFTLNINSNSDLSVAIRGYYNSLGAQQSLSTGQRINLTEHEFIGQYVQGIAKSLSIWDNTRQPYSFYEKLAWGGLETSSAYKMLINKQEIEKIILAEQVANNNAKGIKCP